MLVRVEIVLVLLFVYPVVLTTSIIILVSLDLHVQVVPMQIQQRDHVKTVHLRVLHATNLLHA